MNERQEPAQHMKISSYLIAWQMICVHLDYEIGAREREKSHMNCTLNIMSTKKKSLLTREKKAPTVSQIFTSHLTKNKHVRLVRCSMALISHG